MFTINTQRVPSSKMGGHRSSTCYLSINKWKTGILALLFLLTVGTMVAQTATEGLSYMWDAMSGGYIVSLGTAVDSVIVIASNHTGSEGSGNVVAISSSGFMENTTMVSIALPNTIREIRSNAFRGCTNLRTITFSNVLLTIGERAFEGCTSLTTLVLPLVTMNIGAYAFAGCTNLTAITLAPNMTALGNYAFEGCTSLTQITMPGNLTSVGQGMFKDCSSLSQVTIPADYTMILGDAFAGCTSLTQITLPDSLTNLAGSSFRGTSITSINIPKKVNNLGNPFPGVETLESITVDPANTTYRSEGNCVIHIAWNTLIFGCKTSVIPNTVGTIEMYAFDGITSLTDITIPEGVTLILSYAFRNTGLTSIALPASVINVTPLAFSGCDIETITVAAGNTTYSAEENCLIIIENNTLVMGTKAGNIPASVDIIGQNAFRDVPGLTEIIIPSNVTTINNGAFQGCPNLTSVTMQYGVTSLGGSAFRDCPSLTSVTMAPSVTHIGYSVFQECPSLTSLAIPNSVESIYGDIVRDTPNITSVTIPSSVETMYVDAFNYVPGLQVYLQVASAQPNWQTGWNGLATAVYDAFPSVINIAIATDNALSWALANGGAGTFSHYNVYRDGFIVGTTTDGNFYDLDFPDIDVEYKYWVTAVHTTPDVEFYISNVLDHSYDFYNPRNLIAASGNAVRLTWDAMIDETNGDFECFAIYRDGSPFDSTDVNTYIDDTVVFGEEYTYFVVAIYSTGESMPSNTATARGVNVPTPRDLVAVGGDGAVYLQWILPDLSTRYLSGFLVYRDGVAVSDTLMATFFVDADPTLEAGETYEYSVTAIYLEPDGESMPTTTDVTMPVFAPITAFDGGANLTNSAVNLTWTAPEDANLANLVGYVVFRNDEPISEIITETEFSDRNLTSYTDYIYNVNAVYVVSIGFMQDETIYVESDPMYVSIAIVGEEEIVNEIIVTGLKGNYPNPFNPSTTISFAVGGADLRSQTSDLRKVTIDIYNIKGQKVRSLVNGEFGTGTHTVIWNGNDDNGRSVSSGIYFYRMQTNDYVETKRMVLMK